MQLAVGTERARGQLPAAPRHRPAPDGDGGAPPPLYRQPVRGGPCHALHRGLRAWQQHPEIRRAGGDHPHPPPSQRAPLHRHRRPRSGPRHWGRASGHAGSLQHLGHPGPGPARRAPHDVGIHHQHPAGRGDSGAGPQVAGRGASGIQTNRPPHLCRPAARRPAAGMGQRETAPAIRNGSPAIWPSSGRGRRGCR